MAYPTLASAVSINSTPGKKHNWSMPSGLATGQWLVLIFQCDTQTPAITTPTGYLAMSVSLDVGSSGGAEGKIFYKATDGSEVAGKISTDIDTVSTVISLLVSGVDTTTPPEGGNAQGSSTTPDPPSRTASWGSDTNLWLAYAATSDAEDPSGWTLPSGYSAVQNGRTGATTSDVQTCLAYKNVTAATEDPGTFTISPTASWAAATIVFRPSGGGTSYPAYPPAQEGNGILPFIAQLRRKMSAGKGGHFGDCLDPTYYTTGETITLDKFAPCYEPRRMSPPWRPQGWVAFTQIPEVPVPVDEGWEHWYPQIIRRWMNLRSHTLGMTVTPLSIDPLVTTYLTIAGELTIEPTRFGSTTLVPTYQGEGTLDQEG